jgi:RNA polymerase sigma-70 factor (ECF subfamily)
MTPSATDDDLLVRWRAGDAPAGEALVERYFERLYAFFQTKLEGEADELVQATFLACLSAKDRFRGDASFRTYLFAIAKNQLYNALRDRHRDGARLAFDVSSIRDVVSTQRTRIARGEDRARLVDALQQLPVEQQVLLELHYWEDLAIGELSSIFEAPEVTIRSRLHRARRALRDLLHPESRKLPVGRAAMAIAASLVVGACGLEDDTTVAVEQALGGDSCPPKSCGFNSPEMDHYGFHELHERGDKNSEGFAIRGFRAKDGSDLALDVTKNRLSGYDAVNGRTLRGHDLIGAWILIERDGSDEYIVRIQDVGQIAFPIGTPRAVETYVLEWIPSLNFVPVEEAGIDWVNVCDPQDVDPPPDVPWWESFGQRPVDSILFEGDRFELDTMTTKPGADADWFNIGCAGHTLAKLFLTRNTLASNPVATHDERQATLKMLVGDYCNIGKPFTVAGQALAWQGGLVNFYATPVSLEARWNANGAMCIDTPRMANPTTQAGAAEFPDIWQAIKDHCGTLTPPPCDPAHGYDFAGAERVSANW